MRSKEGFVSRSIILIWEIILTGTIQSGTLGQIMITQSYSGRIRFKIYYWGYHYLIERTVGKGIFNQDVPVWIFGNIPSELSTWNEIKNNFSIMITEIVIEFD